MENWKGRVVRSSKREFDIRLSAQSDGEKTEIISATALGNLLKKDRSVVVGDNVILSKIPETGEWQIIDIEERTSEIYRVSIREQRKRVTAANCDLLVILSSVSKPAYKQGIVDRFLVRACQWGIRPIVVFNKMDQYDADLGPDLLFEKKRLELLGAECFEICAKQAEEYKKQFFDQGWTELQDILKGRTAIFLGQSGVGKSQTISRLSGGEVELKTKEVGKVGKGSHTTTWSELVELPHFYLIDSPGIRSFSLEDINPKELITYFPDLEEIGVNCKFTDCQHEPNSKGCAFYNSNLEENLKEALYSRLDSYKRIYEEVSQIPEWSKKLN
jgi:ribosome biogenesis GTPase / thiamine phosphate phosphatase